MSDVDCFYTEYYGRENEIYDKMSKRRIEILKPQFVDNGDDSPEEHNEYSDASVFHQYVCND